MEWIDVKTALPKPRRQENVVYSNSEDRKILVLMGGKIFLSTFTTAYGYIKLSSDLMFDGCRGKWDIPCHFKEPTHWCEIPELPKIVL